MKKLFLLAAVALLFAGCSTPPSHLGSALIMQVKDTHAVTGERGTKVGRTCGRNILGIFADGDMSVEAAKKAGGITKVATVDTDIKHYVVYSEVCTIVTGE
ncbi:TRL-like family protein [Desulfosarcina sp. OttesenSCG-928-G10]|nr:TRL-like family protein [Desulfosarcina sp. OttesenSCG-928-G10]